MKIKSNLYEPYLNKSDNFFVKNCINDDWVSTAGKNIDKFDSPELANKLFYSSVIGQEIMENFYYSVAKILAFFINFKLAKTSDPFEKPDPDKYIDYFSSDSEFEKVNGVVN